MADSKEKLFSDFIAPTRQEWLDKINVDLKGADYQKKMVWRTNEGFSAEPFYRKEDLEGMAQTDALPGEFPYLRGNKKDNNRWYVRQNIRVTDPKEANEKALDLLNKGVTSLGFKVPAKELNATFISTLLEGIKADAVELNFSTCQGHTVELARLLTAYYDGKGYDRTALVGSIDFDPMQKILTKGKDTTALLNKLAELVNILAPFPKMRCICINADTLCNAGAYIYQELGYALAWGNEYLNLMVEAGIPAALSYTAGSFVCNSLMYTLLYLIDRQYPAMRGGFIHVPYAMEQAVSKPLGTPSMELHQIARGLTLALEAVVENERDLTVNR